MSLRNNKGQFKKGKGFWTGKTRSNMQGKNNPKWVGEKNDRSCQMCGVIFRRTKATTGIPKYCSMKCYGKSKTGKTPWNKYKPYPQVQGKNNNKWKGGITPEHWNIRSLAVYKEWRSGVCERDNHTCRICGNSPEIMVVHHIKSAEKYPKLRFELSNGICLCRKCHNKLHSLHRNIHDFTKTLRDFMSNMEKS